MLLSLSKSNLCWASNFKIPQIKKPGKCINHDVAPGYFTTVMKCLASCTTCILMGHKLFCVLWGFDKSKANKQRAPSLVFRTEKNCSLSHLLACLPASTRLTRDATVQTASTCTLCDHEVTGHRLIHACGAALDRGLSVSSSSSGILMWLWRLWLWNTLRESQDHACFL